MDKIKIILIDSNLLDIDFLLSSPYLKSEDINKINQFKMAESQKEEAVSFILKRKYAGDFYLSKEGKPISSSKYFNIAHSNGVVVYIENKDHPIGIDIELIKPSKDNMREYISSKEEYNYIKSNENFFEIWTSKESLVKAYGSGIKTNIKEIPALPLNGVKNYKDKKYRSKCFKFSNFVISISIEREEDFEYQIKQEKL